MDYATIILTAASWLLMVFGLFLNTFIVIKNLICWWKGQTLQTVDIIMTSLGTVRILFLIFWMPRNVISDAGYKIPANTFFKYLITGSISVETCSLWWGTVLCVFYCVKITNYNNRLFLRLKMNISRLVPWLLLTSAMVSILSSLPVLYSEHGTKSTHVINGTKNGNITLGKKNNNLVIIKSGGSFIPFLIFGAAISLLIVSLLKHTRNMSSKDSGFTKPQLVAHKRAIMNMASFLFFYVLFFISSKLITLTFQLQNPLYGLLCRICYISYPSLHSVMLIVSNGKLKRSILAVLCCVRKSKLN